MIPHLGETKSRVAALVLTEKRLSDSLPDLCKSSRQAGRENYKVTITRTPSFDRAVFNREEVLRQEALVNAPLKNEKVSEQPKSYEK